MGRVLMAFAKKIKEDALAAQRKASVRKTRKVAPKGTASEAKRRKRVGGSGGGALASKAFKKAERQAAKAVKDPKEAAKLEKRAAKKADEHKVDLGATFEHLQTLLRMIHAYAKGEYRELPTKTIVAAGAAVIYFVNPLDLIPDVIAGVGYVDDIAVLLFVVATLEQDLDAFTAWEEAQAKPKRAGRAAKPRTTAKKSSGKATRSKQPAKPTTKAKSASASRRRSGKSSATTKAKATTSSASSKRRSKR